MSNRLPCTSRIADRPNNTGGSGCERGSAIERLKCEQLRYRHLVIGWWCLLLFLSLGIVLESLHGFKIQWYLGVDNETRRLMWTLAHSHGTLLALIQLPMRGSLTGRTGQAPRAHAWISLLLIGAGILMPLGFSVGWRGALLGRSRAGHSAGATRAVMLLIAVLLIALDITRRPSKP